MNRRDKEMKDSKYIIQLKKNDRMIVCIKNVDNLKTNNHSKNITEYFVFIIKTHVICIQTN